MVQKKIRAQFIELPNELVYQIFNFLSKNDIFHAFARINDRYDYLVRFYVRAIELTDVWQGNRQEFQWIRETIQTLKVDQFHIPLLTGRDNWKDMIPSSIQENSIDRNRKSLSHSLIRKITTPFQSCVHETSPLTNYHFPQLHSLELVNVFDWNQVISNMNLKTLRLWFDDEYIYSHEDQTMIAQAIIPPTIIRFSSNVMLNANYFHANLIDMNVCVRSIIDLVGIVQHTPNIQCLSITFAENFGNRYCRDYHPSYRIRSMTNNFYRITNLNHLSINTKQSTNGQNNERLPFDQVELFIDLYCPNKTILKKVALKFDYIMFRTNMWFTIVRYKNTFDRFDFYTSFIVEKEAISSIETLLDIHYFDFYLEDGDLSRSQNCFMHIYSLPFAFDKLYGFSSCSELSFRASFATVRHLYFTQFNFDRLISFESLAKRMPRLVSIDCHFTFKHNYQGTIPKTIVGQDIFNHVRFLNFTSLCWHKECSCRNLLPQLLNRMPHLRYLTTSRDTFIRARHPLPSIKRLDLQICVFISFDSLVQKLPHLSTLLLSSATFDLEHLKQIVGILFVRIPSLTSISIRALRTYNSLDKSRRRKASRVLTHVQKLDNRLRHLKLDFGPTVAIFYLPCA